MWEKMLCPAQYFNHQCIGNLCGSFKDGRCDWKQPPCPVKPAKKPCPANHGWDWCLENCSESVLGCQDIPELKTEKNKEKLNMAVLNEVERKQRLGQQLLEDFEAKTLGEKKEWSPKYICTPSPCEQFRDRYPYLVFAATGFLGEMLYRGESIIDLLDFMEKSLKNLRTHGKMSI